LHSRHKSFVASFAEPMILHAKLLAYGKALVNAVFAFIHVSQPLS